MCSSKKKKWFQQIYLKTKTREEELFTLSKQQHSKYTPECVVINYWIKIAFFYWNFKKNIFFLFQGKKRGQSKNNVNTNKK